MSRPVLVVYTKPVDGREAEYDEWYTNIHLPDILRIDGFVAARRFKMAAADQASHDSLFGYLAIYEVEDGRLEDAKAALAQTLAESRAAEAAGREPSIRMTSALGAERHVAWYEEIAALDAGDSL